MRESILCLPQQSKIMVPVTPSSKFISQVFFFRSFLPIVSFSTGEKPTEEMEHMIHSMPDLHAVHFGDNVMNAIPHDFQKILQVENEHKLYEKEAKEHEKVFAIFITQ